MHASSLSPSERLSEVSVLLCIKLPFVYFAVSITVHWINTNISEQIARMQARNVFTAQTVNMIKYKEFFRH